MATLLDVIMKHSDFMRVTADGAVLTVRVNNANLAEVSCALGHVLARSSCEARLQDVLLRVAVHVDPGTRASAAAGFLRLVHRDLNPRDIIVFGDPRDSPELREALPPGRVQFRTMLPRHRDKILEKTRDASAFHGIAIVQVDDIDMYREVRKGEDEAADELTLSVDLFLDVSRMSRGDLRCLLDQPPAWLEDMPEHMGVLREYTLEYAREYTHGDEAWAGKPGVLEVMVTSFSPLEGKLGDVSTLHDLFINDCDDREIDVEFHGPNKTIEQVVQKRYYDCYDDDAADCSDAIVLAFGFNMIDGRIVDIRRIYGRDQYAVNELWMPEARPAKRRAT